METKIVSQVAGITFVLTLAGVVLVQSAPSGHHPRPLHTPATAYTSVATLVSSGTAVDSAIEALTDDIRSRVYADRADLVTWPMPK